VTCGQADSKQWKEVGLGEVVLRVWEVESDHNYDNDMHVTQVCPLLSCTCVSETLRPLILLQRSIFEKPKFLVEFVYAQ